MCLNVIATQMSANGIRTCCPTIECVLFLQNVFFFPIECVLLLQNVFTDCRMCSLGMKIQVTFDVQTTHARPYRYVFSTECVLYRMCSLSNDVQTTHARPYRYVFSIECVLYRMCSL